MQCQNCEKNRILLMRRINGRVWMLCEDCIGVDIPPDVDDLGPLLTLIALMVVTGIIFCLLL